MFADAKPLPTDVVFDLIEHPLDEIRSAILRPALDHWNAARVGDGRGERAMPSRAGVSPLAIRQAIGLMAIVDVVDGGGGPGGRPISSSACSAPS